jgi:hypothetical protein
MNVLETVVGWLPPKVQPYAKTIAAALSAVLPIASAASGLPLWVTVLAAALSAPVVFAVPNKDPNAEKQAESVQPPTP